MLPSAMCGIYGDKVQFEDVQSDARRGFPKCGSPRPGQAVILCTGCGHVLHADCVSSAGTTILGRDLTFS